MTDLEIQEQAKYKYPQFRDNNSTDSVLIEGFIECAKWMQEQDGWIEIKSKDDLPKTYCNVLIYGCFTRDSPKKVYEACFNPKKRNFISYGTVSKFVTHWQPLPSPPKTK